MGHRTLKAVVECRKQCTKLTHNQAGLLLKSCFQGLVCAGSSLHATAVEDEAARIWVLDSEALQMQDFRCWIIFVFHGNLIDDALTAVPGSFAWPDRAVHVNP